jgi:hypothetical protein
MNWNDVLFRCSCLGKIMTEGKGSILTDKQAEKLLELQKKETLTSKQSEELDNLLLKRDAPPTLSDTCTSYLKEVYIFHKYGKEPVGGAERSKYTMKGKMVEEESIMMLSRLDTIRYEKNDIRYKDSHFTGEPDIIVRNDQDKPEKIIDIKSSYDFASLLSNTGSPLNPLYKYQVQGYMALTGAKKAEVAYCLVNMPMEMINSEKKRLFYALNAATEASPEYLREIERLENNMTFDEIPISERILRFHVYRDDELIEKMRKRVEHCRIWLSEFDNYHSKFNK